MSNRGKKATDLEKRKIKRLYRRGYSDLYIAIELNRSVSFVRKYIKKIKKGE